MSALLATLAHHQVALPLRVSARDTGVVLDAAGRDALTVDVNGERTDAQAVSIAELLALSINGLEALLAALDRAEAAIVAAPNSAAVEGLLAVRADLKDKIRRIRT